MQRLSLFAVGNLAFCLENRCTLTQSESLRELLLRLTVTSEPRVNKAAARALAILGRFCMCACLHACMNICACLHACMNICACMHLCMFVISTFLVVVTSIFLEFLQEKMRICVEL